NLPKTDQSFSDIKLGQDGDLYLLTAMGLYSSSDDGDWWSVYDAGARNSDDKVADELMTITKDGVVFIDKALTINQTDGSTLKQTEYYTLGGYQRSAQMISLSTGEIIMAHRDNWGPKDVTYKISSDGGVTWMDKKASSSFALKNFKHPIFFVNDNDDVYYVGADYSLYRSTDKGESYTSSGTVAEWDEKLSTLDKKTGTFYIAFRMGLNWKLKKSSDHGATFTDIPLPSNEGITSILANDNKIVLSTNYNVRYSNDGGATWTDKSSMFIPSNFPEKFIYNGSGELMAMNANRSGVVLIDFSTNTVTPKVSGITQGSANSHHYNGTSRFVFWVCVLLR
ncbi:MAG: WD40/YVTN/BNR-like repeat-containing protein, partial [Bacteroidia bacterium]